jgi:hypothetical protein
MKATITATVDTGDDTLTNIQVAEMVVATAEFLNESCAHVYEALDVTVVPAP